MESLAANAGSQARRYPRRLLVELSSGCDSPTVAAIARQFGLEEAVVFDSDRNEARDFRRAFHQGAPAQDSGRDVAAALGLRPLSVFHDAWMDSYLPEVPFLAADGYGEGLRLHISTSVRPPGSLARDGGNSLARRRTTSIWPAGSGP